MASKRRREELLQVRSVLALTGYRLRLTLTNGMVVERDVSALLDGPVFEPVRTESGFAKARVVGGSVEWPNGADICPDVLIWGGAPPNNDDAVPREMQILTRENLP